MPLLYADFNQIELWIVALEANDEPFLAIHARDEYVHGAAYEDVFKPELFFEPGKPRRKEFRLPTVTHEKLNRAKAIPHGFNYNRKGASVAKEHNWTEREGRTYEDKYFTVHWAIRDWHKKIDNEVSRDGLLRNKFGRIRRYPIKDNSVYSYKPQSGAADILIRAIPRIFARLTLPSRILLPVHDSLLVQSPWVKMERDAHVLVEEMERPIPQHNNFVFGTELKIGMNWKDADEGNPLGLTTVTLANLPEAVRELEKRYRSSQTAYSIATRGEV